MHYMYILVLQSSLRGRKRFALLFMSYRCIVNILWLFLTGPWVGLQCMIVVWPDHTHLHLVQMSIGLMVIIHTDSC